MNVKLIRIDYRLIHGQVVTKWVKQKNINHIIVINNELASDSFMSDIYEMAAPSEVSVDILHVDQAIANKDDLGDGNILIILKDVKTAYDLINNGFNIEELQIGGLGGENDSVTILPGISVSQNDINLLEEIKNSCKRIYFNTLPSEPVMEIDDVINKYNKNRK
ncbi:PTS sugar transporter subunit IIB [Lactobacillus sp. ESL0791]|uniref:PTS system mannose/fructose/N-acetylgalactosamine-transporter subunit IIB n=1 Tax=Lactobacillus sp. ESL0791 TaxID=2983234 RepID=UPI0023F9185D|nr:PTS sugar transporter subunit IIB [Lactobacillus sp. ESL0791]MDF7639648.1 PTS sugar transporter subunit IIB [Lactobacillus sp. ESL0791]